MPGHGPATAFGFPSWLFVLLLLLVVIVGALIVYGIVAGALNRLLGTRYIVVRSLIERTNGVASCKANIPMLYRGGATKP